MRFEIAIHAQRGGVGRHFAQQAMLHEKTQIVVDRGQRNRRNAFANRSVNLFRGAMAVRGHDGLIDDMALMCRRQAALPCQIPKLLVAEAHDYRMRMIIKHRRAMSIPSRES